MCVFFLSFFSHHTSRFPLFTQSIHGFLWGRGLFSCFPIVYFHSKRPLFRPLRLLFFRIKHYSDRWHKAAQRRLHPEINTARSFGFDCRSCNAQLRNAILLRAARQQQPHDSFWFVCFYSVFTPPPTFRKWMKMETDKMKRGGKKSIKGASTISCCCSINGCSHLVQSWWWWGAPTWRSFYHLLVSIIHPK